jgi:hypothetical protein
MPIHGEKVSFKLVELHNVPPQTSEHPLGVSKRLEEFDKMILLDKTIKKATKNKIQILSFVFISIH